MPDIAAPTDEQLATAKEARGENEAILDYGYDVVVSDLAGENPYGESEEEATEEDEEDDPIPSFRLVGEK